MNNLYQINFVKQACLQKLGYLAKQISFYENHYEPRLLLDIAQNLQWIDVTELPNQQSIDYKAQEIHCEQYDNICRKGSKVVNNVLIMPNLKFD